MGHSAKTRLKFEHVAEIEGIFSLPWQKRPPIRAIAEKYGVGVMIVKRVGEAMDYPYLRYARSPNGLAVPNRDLQVVRRQADIDAHVRKVAARKTALEERQQKCRERNSDRERRKSGPRISDITRIVTQVIDPKPEPMIGRTSEPSADDLREFVASGMTLTEIGRRLNMLAGSVLYRMKKFGVEPPRPRERETRPSSICEICGEPYVPRRNANARSRKLCSPECRTVADNRRYAAERTERQARDLAAGRKLAACVICKTQFMVRTGTSGRFCSRTCYDKSVVREAIALGEMPPAPLVPQKLPPATQDRCAEKGCPFPAIAADRCRQHFVDQYAESSMGIGSGAMMIGAGIFSGA